MKKKLLFYTPMSLHEGAGFQEWLERSVKTLSSRYDISIISGTLGERMRWGSDTVRQKFEGCRHDISVSYRVLFRSFCIPSIRMWPKIYCEFKAHDAVYLNHSFRLHDPIPKLLCWLAGGKIVLGFHSPFRKTPGRMLYFNLACLLFRYVRACHVVNTTLKKILTNKKYVSVFYIPNYLLKEKLPAAPFADYEGGIVFVGRDEHQKGLDLLSAAIRKVLKFYPKLKFVFFGTGKQKPIIQRLQERFPHNIKDCGYEIDKDKMYKGRKYLVLTSRDEPFGLVVIEAMSYGVPVLATPTAGPLDIIEDGRDGLLASEISEEGITRVLLRAIALNREEYHKLSMRAFKKIPSRYLQDKFQENFCAMVEKVCGRR